MHEGDSYFQRLIVIFSGHEVQHNIQTLTEEANFPTAPFCFEHPGERRGPNGRPRCVCAEPSSAGAEAPTPTARGEQGEKAAPREKKVPVRHSGGDRAFF